MIEIGICSKVANAAVLAKAGVAFIEENVQSFLMPEASDADFAPSLEAAKRSPLPVPAANCFLPASLKCVGPEVDAAQIERYAETAFRRAAEAGVETVVFGSGGARRVPDGFPMDEAFDQFVEIVRRIAPAAESRGVTLVVEPLNRGECNLVNSLAEGAEVVRCSAHGSVRLLADVFHMLRDGEAASEIARHGALIRHAHIAEAKDRTPPGVAGDDFGAFLAAFREAGYTGRLAIEGVWSNLALQAAGAVASLRGQLRSAGV